jgi:methionyl aminopeptidase
MNSEIRKKYELAAKISQEARELAKRELKDGVSVLQFGEKIEKAIIDSGGKFAFPVNISINDIAAHYTPDINDQLKFKDEDMVKIDVGVQIDGYIWDAAFTKKIGRESDDIIKASEQALEAALKIIKPGVRVFEISEAVVSTVEKFGLKTVENLSGHGLDQYVQHAPPSILNARNKIQTELKEGTAVAMEVFTTDGTGYVKEGTQTFIYRYIQDRPVRSQEARRILSMARENFEELPFATRWVQSVASGIRLQLALKELVDSGCLDAYPILKEAGGGKVAQTETTVLL